MTGILNSCKAEIFLVKMLDISTDSEQAVRDRVVCFPYIISSYHLQSRAKNMGKLRQGKKKLSPQTKH